MRATTGPAQTIGDERMQYYTCQPGSTQPTRVNPEKTRVVPPRRVPIFYTVAIYPEFLFPEISLCDETLLPY